jgi:hypothetical protein
MYLPFDVSRKPFAALFCLYNMIENKILQNQTKLGSPYFCQNPLYAQLMPHPTNKKISLGMQPLLAILNFTN